MIPTASRDTNLGFLWLPSDQVRGGHPIFTESPPGTHEGFVHFVQGFGERDFYLDRSVTA